MKNLIIVISLVFSGCASYNFMYISKSVVIPQEKERVAWSRAQSYVIRNGNTLNKYTLDFFLVPRDVRVEDNFIQISYFYPGKNEYYYSFFITKEVDENKNFIFRINNPIMVYGFMGKVHYEDGEMVANYTTINNIIEYITTGKSKNMVDSIDVKDLHKELDDKRWGYNNKKFKEINTK